LKVIVYTIAKNEEKFVDRWVDSMSEADEIYVMDTGSTDNTVEKLRQRGVNVTVNPISPWRFDVARNESLNLVPDDADICVCTDLDEVFEVGWRDLIEKVWICGNKERGTRLVYAYYWEVNEDGTPLVAIGYNKIHDRHSVVWVGAVHEYVGVKEGYELFHIEQEKLILRHYPDITKSRASYYDLMVERLEAVPDDTMMLNYITREHLLRKEYQSVIEKGNRYLSIVNRLDEPAEKERRAELFCWMGQAFYELGEPIQMHKAYLLAMAELPLSRTPLVQLADRCCISGDYISALGYIERAIRIPINHLDYSNDRNALGDHPYYVAYVSAMNIGATELAQHYLNVGLEKFPTSETLKKLQNEKEEIL